MPSISIREKQIERKNWKRIAHDETLPAKERLAAIGKLFPSGTFSTRYQSLVTRLRKPPTGKKFSGAVRAEVPPDYPAGVPDNSVLPHPGLSLDESKKLDALMRKSGMSLHARPNPKPVITEFDEELQRLIDKLRAPDDPITPEKPVDPDLEAFSAPLGSA